MAIQIKTRLSLLITITSVFSFNLISVQNALALGIFDPRPGPWSLAREKECAGGNIASCYLWLLDPSGEISEIGFEIRYDSSKMTILPEESGFLCDFSEDGSCPQTQPGTTGNGLSTFPGGPRSGTTFDFSVTDDTILLSYDLSNNPALSGSDRNFFAIAFIPTDPSLGVVFHNEPGVGDFYQVLGSNHYCRTPEGETCGSNSPIFGASLVPVPEPTSILSLLSLGILGAGVTLKGKVKRTNSTEKETTKIG